MRVAVSGAAGNVGRHVVADLLARGHEVTALDRSTPDEGVGNAGAASAGAPNAPSGTAGAVSWQVGDVRDPSQAARLVAGADALIHLAAIPAPTLGTPLEVFTANTQATFVVLEAAGEAGVRRVALASSISLLGLPWSPHPISPLYAPVDEEHPNIGSDPYALSKEVDEATAALMHRRHGYQVAALRICATAPMEVHLARQARVAADPTFLANELWAYLDVRDGARAFVLAVERDIPGCHVINVAAPDTYSPLPSSELMALAHPSTPLRRPLRGRETLFDTTRCHDLLGFEPIHRLPPTGPIASPTE